MNPKINIITLGTKDLKKASSFYTSLGFQKSSASQNDIVFFKLNGIVLALYPREKLADDANVESKEQNNGRFSGITFAHNAKSEKDVDGILNSAAKKGAKIVKKAQKVFSGGYSGYFSDPDGYLWEVAYNPFFKFNENDDLILP